MDDDVRRLSVPSFKVLKSKKDWNRFLRWLLLDAGAEGVREFILGTEQVIPYPQIGDYERLATTSETTEDNPEVQFKMQYTAEVEAPQPLMPGGLTANSPKKVKVQKEKEVKKRKSELTSEELEAYNKHLRDQARRSSRTTLGPEDVSSLLQKVSLEDRRDKGLDFKSQLALFSYNQDQAEKSQRRERKALAMIINRLHESIQLSVRHINDPHEMISFLENMYKESPVKELERAFTRFELIHFSRFGNVQEYLNEMHAAKMDIEEAGGSVSEEAMVSKLIRGLLGEHKFKDFVHHYHMFRDMDQSLQEFPVLSTRLLTWETDIEDSKQVVTYGRISRDSIPSKSGRVEASKASGNCNKCGKKGHYARDCRTKDTSPRPNTNKPKTSSKKPFGKKYAALATADSEDVTARLEAHAASKQGLKRFLA